MYLLFFGRRWGFSFLVFLLSDNKREVTLEMSTIREFMVLLCAYGKNATKSHIKQTALVADEEHTILATSRAKLVSRNFQSSVYNYCTIPSTFHISIGCIIHILGE